MASSINALSYLDPTAYQSIAPSSTTATTSSTSPTSGVSATDELKAIESQGDLQAFLSSSMALAVLQPAGATDSATTNSATLVSNMMQQVLGAYQAQAAPDTPASTNTAASGVSALG